MWVCCLVCDGVDDEDDDDDGDGDAYNTIIYIH